MVQNEIKQNFPQDFKDIPAGDVIQYVFGSRLGDLKNFRIPISKLIESIGIISSGGTPVYFEGDQLPSKNNLDQDLQKGDWSILPNYITYNNINSGPDIIPVDGHLNFAQFNGSTWSLIDMGELPANPVSEEFNDTNELAVKGNVIYNGTIKPVDLTKTVGSQLFDKSNHVLSGYFVTTAVNGGVQPVANWKVAVIPVNEGQRRISLSGWGSATKTIAFYSEHVPVPDNGNILFGGRITDYKDENNKSYSVSGGALNDLLMPLGTKCVVINIRRNDELDSVFSKLMVNYGSTVLPYQTYVNAVSKIKESEIASSYVKIGESLVSASNLQLKDNKGMEISSVSGVLSVRSSFDATRDIVRQISLFGSNNGASNLLSSKLIGKTDAINATGVEFHGMNDTVPTPLQIASVPTGHLNVSGNHGLGSVLDATATAHGKTSSDIGSEWSGANGKGVYLVAILNANTLRFVAKPYTDVDGLDKIDFANSPLTHVSGASNTASITFTGAFYEYKPVIRNISVKAFVDDKELSQDGTYFGSVVKVIDTHTVADPTRPNLTGDYLPQNNGALAIRTITHYFHANNSYVADEVINCQKSHKYRNAGIIQPQVLTLGSYTGLKAYGMNITPATGTDFNNGLELVGAITAKNIPVSRVADQNQTIQQLTEILSDSTGKAVGAGFGYNPLVGVGKKESLNGITEYLFGISTAKKHYPRGFTQISGTDIIRGIGYMAYWDCKVNPSLVADYFVPFGKSDMYYLQLGEAVSKKLITLDKKIVSREFEVVRKSEGLTLHIDNATTEQGIYVSGGIGDYLVILIK